MVDTTQEIAVYIHRFHNLDLFQQGWYQVKMTVKWEDDEYTSPITLARVVQYEGFDLPSDDVGGEGWRISDVENSFCTQPFRIKYARQDVLLSTLVAFDLSLGADEGPSTSAVIVKFELMYAPISEERPDVQSSLDASSAAIHEFRVPPKALLGLHSYCPVHFDIFHSVLVDTTVHIGLLKSSPPPTKVPSAPRGLERVAGKRFTLLNQALGQVASINSKEVTLLKALLATRDILLEELQILSKATDASVDFTAIISKLKDLEFSSFLEAGLGACESTGQGKPQNGVKRTNGTLNFASDVLLESLSGDDIMMSLHAMGEQGLYLWNTFLKFHRVNKRKILEFLRDVWAKDRRAEWSIWMVYTKAEMPHYICCGAEESHQSSHKKSSSLWRLPDDPAQTAATRAELHRRSIAQMKINNRSIQDMQIYGDPLRIPVVIVERVADLLCRNTNNKSDLNLQKDPDLNTQKDPRFIPEPVTVSKQGGTNQHQSGRVLKIVVFVHGFQGHHLDLRLVRNQWLLVDPRIEFLMSEVNEDKTSGDFREMGLRLAQEVVAFFKKKVDKASRSGPLREIKISFVGHSIGNVILRAALADANMEPLLGCLNTYVSISGPHLGYLYSSNSLFNSGLWLLKKLKNTQCIHQLTCTDDPDLRNTFFYNLSKQKTLENFRHIILLSSPQDGYVPYHSARIEMSPYCSMDNSKKSKVFMEMLNACLDQIRAPSSNNRIFMRCDVNFDSSAYGKNFDSFIGRTAHIEFLESDIYAKFIMWSFPELFS